MSGVTAPEFAGIHRAINPPDSEEWAQPLPGEVDDDRDGEQETFPDKEPSIEDPEAMVIDEANQDQMAELQSSLLNASKGVTEGTDAEYRRYTFQTWHWASANQ